MGNPSGWLGALRKAIPSRVRKAIKELTGVASASDIAVLKEELESLKNYAAEHGHKELTGVASASDIATLEEELKNLKNYATEHENIDLVRTRSFLSFVYKTDLWYLNHPEEFRNLGNVSSSELLASADATAQKEDIEEFLAKWQSPDTAFQRLLAHFLQNLPDFSLVDVGCYYGVVAMDSARFIRSLGHDTRIIAFDPGIAGKLAPLNFLNNGFGDMIEFHPYAVGNYDGYVLRFREVGSADNNRIVNRVGHLEQFSAPVKSISLDSFLPSIDCIGPLVIKIDTQGAEYEVFSGLRNTLATRIVAGLTEFVPNALESRVDPVTFLRDLMTTHVLYDVGPFHTQLKIIEEDGLAEHVSNVDGSKDKWTDILFIPRNLPRLDVLLDDFNAVSARESGE